MKKNAKIPAWVKSIGLGFAILLAFVVYAYGFKVTKVNLAETKSPVRQTQLARIIRAMANPDILAYDEKETDISAEIFVPCPSGGAPTAQPSIDKTGPYLVINPSCADPGSTVVIEGFNFPKKVSGSLSFIPPSAVTLSLADVETDETGHFNVQVKLPERASDQPQNIQMAMTIKSGAPRFSQTALDTWDKIVETVFLALLATTLGMIFAMPLSFFAARNLMKEITGSLTGVAISMILMPIGLVVGAQAAVWMGDLSQIFMRNLVVNICVVAVLPIFLTAAMRWSLPQVELIKATRKMRVLRTIVLVIAVILGIFWLYLFANLASLFGKALLPILGGGGFVGTFISDLGDILTMIIVLTSALMGAGVCNSLAGKIGMRVQRDLKPHVIKALNIVLCGLAGALLGYIIALGLNWLYSFENINQIRFVLIAIFSALGVLLAIRTKALASIPVGLVIYYISRTIFNALRSIEALIMVIVFVVWVGIGPFAGVLALSLHTIASLAKLYSEQVESIISGPVEAVKATGANNIQTIIYGVIPQIIPPYISFTMYRWDTNVRMSTIIGFAGGGGIGFLLIQNINLLNYRAASTQMIAIALVVASMDYLSSQMRERVV